jgi:hypothetical protein
MLFTFSTEEYTNIHSLYGFCNGNAKAATGEYWQQFPHWTIPNQQVFATIDQHLCETDKQ